MSTDIFVVLKNKDFTEGRGPMLYHRTYTTFEEADAYVMKQTGIFGGEQKREKTYGESTSYNGYRIIRDAIIESASFDDFLVGRSMSQLIAQLSTEIDLGNTHHATLVSAMLTECLSEMSPTDLEAAIIEAKV